jgi:ABC-type uncharacterized transport system ATPase component
VVIGSNGSGKSTLLNLVAGTLRQGASTWAVAPCTACEITSGPAGSAG